MCQHIRLEAKLYYNQFHFRRTVLDAKIFDVCLIFFLPNALAAETFVLVKNVTNVTTLLALLFGNSESTALLHNYRLLPWKQN